MNSNTTDQQEPSPAPDLFGPLAYVPEIWSVEKDTIYAAIPAVESGLEYARECLARHDSELGRTRLKNKTWAETMEKDIRHMERTLGMLQACGPNAAVALFAVALPDTQGGFCYLTDGEGDPPRTYTPEFANSYSTRREAAAAIIEARKTTLTPRVMIVVPHPANAATLARAGGDQLQHDKSAAARRQQ